MGDFRVTMVDRALNEAMLMLAEDPRVVFLGQNVAYDGNVLYRHFEGIPTERRIEMPVAEEMQTGIAIGLSLQGYIPVSVYPRMDFLLRAMDQIVNHLDKLEAMSRGQYKPKVIIRTKVGARTPLDAGPQHTQDHVEALRLMLANVSVIRLRQMEEAVPVYRTALDSVKSTLVVEDIR